MSRKKHHRFVQNAQSDNVIERGKELYSSICGKWRELYFNNNKPLVVELACGRGEYTVGLAQQFPDKNFIGVDIKGDRIARGSKIASDLGLQNVAFLRTDIRFLHEFFVENELDEIWLIHPDPQPLDKWEHKRLSNATYLDKYAHYLKPEGQFHLKTDNSFLFEYTLEVLKNAPFNLLHATTDLDNSPLYEQHFGIHTYYEGKFKAEGFKINYLQALNTFPYTLRVKNKAISTNGLI